MSLWTAIVIIVALAVFADVLKSRYRAQHGITEDEDGNERIVHREDAALKRELEELRERVKVLERIATDGRDTRRLSEEIEKLRDK